ncbi:VTT domain-containing protein [Candidatus Shapirobacteria bacterium]|nr:VTT domain-containing protein [Candidatus Shapirobacteria bacterium]
MYQFIPSLRLLAQTLPLEAFIFIGTILEEIVSPIPAPLILGAAGSLAHTQGRHFLYIIILTLIATTAKTLVSWLFYLLSDKTEDFIFKKFGKFLAVKHEDVEKIGAYFNGGWKDDFIIILARAIPVVPTTTVSLVAGFIKLDQSSFVRSTFIGYFIRCFIFIYLGFTGANSVDSLGTDQFDFTSTIIGAILLLALFLLYLFNPFNRGKK